MSTITDTLEASLFHIMVVSTDNGEGSGLNTSCVNGACNCVPAPLCCENACSSGVSCNGFDCADLPITDCDRTWGTGRMYDASGTYCTIDDDRRYMLHTQSDLEATFSCAANVGVYGNAGEKPMLAMMSALEPDVNEPGGCNEGFLRDDAILVVTVITDEEDDNAVSPDELPGSREIHRSGSMRSSKPRAATQRPSSSLRSSETAIVPTEGAPGAACRRPADRERKTHRGYRPSPRDFRSVASAACARQTTPRSLRRPSA